MSLVADGGPVAPEFDSGSAGAEVILLLSDGRSLRQRVENDEMQRLQTDGVDDEALLRKLRECAEGLLDSEQIDRLGELCFTVERLNDVRELMAATGVN